LIAFRGSEGAAGREYRSGTAPIPSSSRAISGMRSTRPPTPSAAPLPAKETGGIYDQAPGFKDAENGDLSIPGRKADEPGVRPEK
jgi:hypothetical protein